MLGLLSLIKQILFNVCLSVRRLEVHDLFSRVIYCCNLTALRSALSFHYPDVPSCRRHCALITRAFFLCLLQSIDPSQQFTWEHSNLEVNKPKNRYANVIAYDHTRVILAPIEGESGWRGAFISEPS